jgi:hypothetical protein
MPDYGYAMGKAFDGVFFIALLLYERGIVHCFVNP